MQTTLNQRQNDDPHDVLVVAPDVALVVPTDEELARLAQTMRQSPSSQFRAGADFPAGATIPTVDTTFRPTVDDAPVPGRARTIGGRATHAFATALLLAVSGGAVAFGWQAYGDDAKSTVAQWVPQRVLALILPIEKPALAEPSTPAAIEAAAADTPAAQPAAQPPAAPEAAASTAAAAPALEPAEQLRSMARDLANAGQQIERLKASIEELKAGQQQMSREIAKASEARSSEVRAPEPNLRPKLSALPPRPAPVRVHKPMPPLPQSQAATYPAMPQTAAPYAPPPIAPPPQAATQTLADPELASVPRPPMPLR